jgi:hypothetical protein
MREMDNQVNFCPPALQRSDRDHGDPNSCTQGRVPWESGVATGVVVAFTLWFVGFMVSGGEWFLM